jgi:hypothetical protein
MTGIGEAADQVGRSVMAALRHRPMLVGSLKPIDPRARRDARAVSVYNAIEEGGLAELARSAQPSDIARGKTFIGEGEPTS